MYMYTMYVRIMAKVYVHVHVHVYVKYLIKVMRIVCGVRDITIPASPVKRMERLFLSSSMGASMIRSQEVLKMFSEESVVELQANKYKQAKVCNTHTDQCYVACTYTCIILYTCTA